MTILCFKIDGRLFGIDILLIREIQERFVHTPVDRSPPCVSGVLNLRGQIATLLDPGVLLGLREEPGLTENSSCVILKKAQELKGVDDRTSDDLLALQVDEIIDLLELRPEEISPPPANLNDMNPVLVRGVIDSEHGVIVLLSCGEMLLSQS